MSEPITVQEFFDRFAELRDGLAAENLDDLSDSELAAQTIALHRLIDRAKDICAAAERSAQG